MNLFKSQKQKQTLKINYYYKMEVRHFSDYRLHESLDP